MKYCKKCHKKIIEKIYTETEYVNSCRCDKIPVIQVGSQLDGVIEKQLTRGNRNGLKKRLQQRG